MRIISGRLKGMNITVPKTGTRPTTDRVKEAMFSHLENDGLIEGASVLDLFAGSGALGFEAVSRGARSLTLVDISAPAVGFLKKNVAELQKILRSQVEVRVVKQKAQTFAAALVETNSEGRERVDNAGRMHEVDSASYSLIFLDPPYEYSVADFDLLLSTLASSQAVTNDCVIVCERSSRTPQPTAPDGWQFAETKTYGETWLGYLERVQ
jgi:16S rRNA (guanine966-N2)-methyltransferase